MSWVRLQPLKQATCLPQISLCSDTDEAAWSNLVWLRVHPQFGKSSKSDLAGCFGNAFPSIWHCWLVWSQQKIHPTPGMSTPSRQSSWALYLGESHFLLQKTWGLVGHASFSIRNWGSYIPVKLASGTWSTLGVQASLWPVLWVNLNGFLSRTDGWLWMIAGLRPQRYHPGDSNEAAHLCSVVFWHLHSSQPNLSFSSSAVQAYPGPGLLLFCPVCSASSSPRGCPFLPLGSWLECHFLRHTMSDHPAGGA